MNKVGGLSDLELSDLIVISIFGGVDTTRSQLGLGIVTFIKHPGEWVKLIAGDDALMVDCIKDKIEFVQSDARIKFCFSDFNLLPAIFIFAMLQQTI